MKWKSIDLSSKLSLTYGGNANYYKSAHHSIPTLPVGTGNREHPGNFQNKSVNSPFNWFSRYILFLPTLKGKERPFFGKVQEGGPHCEITPKSTWYKRWKSVSFHEIWNNPIPLLFFTRPPYKQRLQNMEIYSKLADRF